MSNMHHKGNSRKAIKSLVVTTFTEFLNTLSCISASLKKKPKTQKTQNQKNPQNTTKQKQQRALDYFLTLSKPELANLDEVFQNLFCFIGTHLLNNETVMAVRQNTYFLTSCAVYWEMRLKNP